MFQVPTLEPKKHKKSVLSLMKVYKFQFLQKRVSGILYLRCLSTLDRIRSTELTGYGRVSFLIKLQALAGLGPATLLKKGLWHRCFPVNFAIFLGTPFSQNTSGRLLLWIAFSSFRINYRI